MIIKNPVGTKNDPLRRGYCYAEENSPKAKVQYLYNLVRLLRARGIDACTKIYIENGIKELWLVVPQSQFDATGIIMDSKNFQIEKLKSAGYDTSEFEE